MHIMEGFLPAKHCLAWGAAAAPFAPCRLADRASDQMTQVHASNTFDSVSLLLWIGMPSHALTWNFAPA